MADRAIMKGNEALAEAAIRYGCRFYFGYPITPQTEILEYMSWRMAEVGGTLVQTEDELTGLHMAMGAGIAGARVLSSSAGPGFALFHEGLSYLNGTRVPAVVIDVQRYGAACGDIGVSQADYEEVTRAGGNGDSMFLTFTPNSVQEAVDMVGVAFDKAEEYRLPCIIMTDAIMGQMMEGVTLPDFKEHDINYADWTIKPLKDGEDGKVLSNFDLYWPEGLVAFEEVLRNMYLDMEDKEQDWESVEVADADVVAVAYGTSSRVCKEAVKKARAKGVKLGLIRPKRVVPFPTKAFAEIPATCKGIMLVEMNVKGQMKGDVKLATECNIPVFAYLSQTIVPDVDIVIEYAEEIAAGKADEVKKWA